MADWLSHLWPFDPQEREEREYKKNENWHLRVCNKIATECNFPMNEIIEIYMGNEGHDLDFPGLVHPKLYMLTSRVFAPYAFSVTLICHLLQILMYFVLCLGKAQTLNC